MLAAHYFQLCLSEHLMLCLLSQRHSISLQAFLSVHAPRLSLPRVMEHLCSTVFSTGHPSHCKWSYSWPLMRFIKHPGSLPLQHRPVHMCPHGSNCVWLWEQKQTNMYLRQEAMSSHM